MTFFLDIKHKKIRKNSLIFLQRVTLNRSEERSVRIFNKTGREVYQQFNKTGREVYLQLNKTGREVYQQLNKTGREVCLFSYKKKIVREIKMSKIKKILKNKNKNYERIITEENDFPISSSNSSSFSTSNIFLDSKSSNKSSKSSLSFLSFFFLLIQKLLLLIQKDYKECLKSIQKFPKEIYFIYYLKFLESYSYFALSQIFVLYLHNEFHISDIEAGMVYGMW